MSTLPPMVYNSPMGGEIGPEVGSSLDRGRLRRGLVSAVILSAATLIIISLLTLDRDTFSALSRLSPGFLILAAAFALGKWLWSVWRMSILARCAGREVAARDLAKTVYAGCFCGLVTPWRAGGVIGETAFLYTYGMDVGEAVAVVSFGACVSTALLMLFFPFAIWMATHFLTLSISIRGVLFAALGVGVLYLGLVLWALLRPHATVGNTLLNHSPSFLRKREWYRRFLALLSEEIQTFVSSLRVIAGLGRPRFAAVVALTALYWITGFLAIPVAVVGLGYGSYFWKAMVAQIVVQILMPFMPTPGASGVGEVGFLFVYASVLPDMGTAGLLTLIWRFIDFYLGLLVGGSAFIMIMRDVARGRRRRVAEAEVGGRPETQGGGASDREKGLEAEGAADVGAKSEPEAEGGKAAG